MEELFEKASRDRARVKIHRLKHLYRHGISFVVFNLLVIIGSKAGFGLHPAVWYNCLIGTFVVGGFILLAHTAIVFGPQLLKGKGWEERKMQEFLKEEQDKNNTNQK